MWLRPKIICTCSPTSHSQLPSSSHKRTNIRLIRLRLLAQAQRVLSTLLRTGSIARSISDATGSVFGHVADALCGVAQSACGALDCVAEDVAETADCGWCCIVRYGTVTMG